jgi:anti-sigma regulatory factor (Ser/Thr protein kinase)
MQSSSFREQVFKEEASLHDFYSLTTVVMEGLKNTVIYEGRETRQK